MNDVQINENELTKDLCSIVHLLMKKLGVEEFVVSMDDVRDLHAELTVSRNPSDIFDSTVKIKSKAINTDPLSQFDFS